MLNPSLQRYRHRRCVEVAFLATRPEESRRKVFREKNKETHSDEKQSPVDLSPGFSSFLRPSCIPASVMTES